MNTFHAFYSIYFEIRLIFIFYFQTSTITYINYLQVMYIYKILSFLMCFFSKKTNYLLRTMTSQKFFLHVTCISLKW